MILNISNSSHESFGPATLKKNILFFSNSILNLFGEGSNINDIRESSIVRTVRLLTSLIYGGSWGYGSYAEDNLLQDRC